MPRILVLLLVSLLALPRLADPANSRGLGTRIDLRIAAGKIDTADIITELPASPLPAERLSLEITEGSMVSDPKHALEMITAYREKHLSLSIVDFGSGYSSLAYFQKLPVQELKIDKYFVTDYDLLVQYGCDCAPRVSLSASPFHSAWY